MMIFGYVKGLRGPEPQLWRDDMPQCHQVLWSIKLKSTTGLTLAQLAELYPYKEPPL